MKKILFCLALLLFSVQAQASQRELIESVKQGNLSGLLELLDSGEDVNAANEQGNTALHYAVAMDNADITQVLLAYGADLNAANQKGWTPYSIAQKKQLKNVTPVIEKALQQQKEKVAATADKKIAEAEQKVQQMKNSAQQKIEDKPVATAKTEQVPAVKPEIVAKPALAVKVPEQNKTAPAKTDPVKTPQKPTLQVQKPQKVVLQKSKLNEKIYAGDEEITYCLNYLGHGENESMLHGAGFFAASAGITEERYKQISSEVESFLANASEQDTQKRNQECGTIITPKNNEKQNQIIRSINRGIGV